MRDSFHWLPASASTAASRFNHLFLSLLILSGVVAFILAFLVIYFSIRYRRGSKTDRSNPPGKGLRVEVAWTLIPLLMFIAVFAWAAYDYANLRSAPDNAMPIFVVAKQWMWKLEHANGRREINELHVPLGQPVQLVMASQDVIHSFFVPAFRIKQDVVPGRYTSLWFTATQLGEYDLFCAEYCGTNHAGMRGRVTVMRPSDFARWLQQGPEQMSIANRGFALFRRFGCSGCHNVNSTVHAPDLNNIFGRVVHLQNGQALIADENYLRDSIVTPNKQVVAGFAPVMPSFLGQISEEDLMAIVEYLKVRS